MRRGITLVELVVALGFVGALLIILAPAVNLARESSRRNVCAGNLKKIALGVLEREEATRYFPAATTFGQALPSDGLQAEANRGNWVVEILPFVQQVALHDSYEPAKSPADESNRPVRSRQLPMFLCPSDEFNRSPFHGTTGGDTSAWGDDWARGNYGANSSLRFLGNDCCSGEASGSSTEGWADRLRRGVMGFNAGVKASQITDGLGTTILILELRAGVMPYDPRGVWALGMPGASSLWAHGGSFHHAKGPNSAFVSADDIPNCVQLRAAFGGPVGLAGKRMGCSPGGTLLWQGAAPRSMHDGGLFVACADGSVRWMSDCVDFMPSSAHALSVWDRLNLSADGQLVSVDAL